MNTDKAYIQKLIDRFMSGETSVDEEQTLALFFSSTDIVPPEWADYKKMFAYFDAGMPLATEKQKPRRMKWVAAAAAVAVLLAGAAVWFGHQADDQPQLAKTETVMPHQPKAEQAAVEPIQLSTDAPKAEEPMVAKKAATKRNTPIRTRKEASSHHEMTDMEILEYVRGVEERIRQAEESADYYEFVAFNQMMEDAGYQAVRLEDGSLNYVSRTELANL